MSVCWGTSDRTSFWTIENVLLYLVAQSTDGRVCRGDGVQCTWRCRRCCSHRSDGLRFIVAASLRQIIMDRGTQRVWFPQLVEERRADHVVGGAQYHGAAAAHDFVLHAAKRW